MTDLEGKLSKLNSQSPWCGYNLDFGETPLSAEIIMQVNQEGLFTCVCLSNDPEKNKCPYFSEKKYEGQNVEFNQKPICTYKIEF